MQVLLLLGFDMDVRAATFIVLDEVGISIGDVFTGFPGEEFEIAGGRPGKEKRPNGSAAVWL